MTISLCMRVSHHLRFARQALASAARVLRPDEILLSVADLDYDVKRAFPEDVNVRVFPGVRDRTKMIPLWFDLFDQAEGDWIVNLDDDDIALRSTMPLVNSSNIGFVHGDVIAVYISTDKEVRAGQILPRHSRQIDHPSDANRAIGSYWAMRREAWTDVAGHVERDQAGYNDFRIVWHLLKAGWKDHHIERYTQVQRARPHLDPFYEEVRQTIGTWSGVAEHLEATFGRAYHR